jgi:hypothetical protein
MAWDTLGKAIHLKGSEILSKVFRHIQKQSNLMRKVPLKDL